MKKYLEIAGIDPGPESSALVVIRVPDFDPQNNLMCEAVCSHCILENSMILHRIKVMCNPSVLLAYEKIATY